MDIGAIDFIVEGATFQLYDRNVQLIIHGGSWLQFVTDWLFCKNSSRLQAFARSFAYLCGMELQTIVQIGKPGFRLDYATRILMAGSCFVENIGERMKGLQFDVDVNPCGIVYNPLSVADTLDLLLEGRALAEADLWHRGGLWGSFRHHGSFSAPTAEECLRKINGRLEESACRLAGTDVLVVTWGTAWVYMRKGDGRLVSNCHKFPAADFDRRRLEVEEIVERYAALFRRLRALRPGLRVLFTVSPIRHWKDGAHGNQLSKAILLLAADRLVQAYDFVSYFPSYEIVMDELRDYRFYAPDMLHISEQGVDYIWERFRDLYFTPEARAVMREVEKCNKILAHRPAYPDSEETVRLRREAAEKRERLIRAARESACCRAGSST